MVNRKGLNNLEVLIMEVNSPTPSKEKKIVTLLENWLKAMQVNKYVVADTDLPVNTKPILISFLK